MLTSDEIADRSSRAAAAAAAAARAAGLTVADPRVLYDVFSVVVHLAPAPVVARVPTVVPASVAPNPPAQAVQQRVELAVTQWLAERGHPVVRPSPLVAPQPVCRDGYSMTFWQFVEQVPDATVDPERRGALVAELHAALRDYPAELPFLLPLNDGFIPGALAKLANRPDLINAADLARAQREWELLAPVVTSRAGFAMRFPHVGVQPLHGDAPGYNVIATTAGKLYSDFEHACLGPVEWDLTLLPDEDRAGYDDATARLGLRRLDPLVQRVLDAARYLQVVACLILAPQLPVLVEGLREPLAQWRATPLAGGLSEPVG